MIPQGTPEWVKARVGLLTASRMADAMAIKAPKTAWHRLSPEGEWVKLGNGITAEKQVAAARKRGERVEVRQYEDGGEYAERANYRMDLVAERLTGFAKDHHVTPEMQWGLDYEDEAKRAFEVHTGNLIVPAGLIEHPRIPFFAATPDGFVDGDLYEGKAPSTEKHIAWILGGKVPDEHVAQMLAQCACTGRRRVHFFSYDPRLPKAQRCFWRIYEPTDDELAEVEAAAIEFLASVDALFDLVTQRAAE